MLESNQTEAVVNAFLSRRPQFAAPRPAQTAISYAADWVADAVIATSINDPVSVMRNDVRRWIENSFENEKLDTARVDDFIERLYKAGAGIVKRSIPSDACIVSIFLRQIANCEDDTKNPVDLHNFTNDTIQAVLDGVRKKLVEHIDKETSKLEFEVIHATKFILDKRKGSEKNV